MDNTVVDFYDANTNNVTTILPPTPPEPMMTFCQDIRFHLVSLVFQRITFCRTELFPSDVPNTYDR